MICALRLARWMDSGKEAALHVSLCKYMPGVGVGKQTCTQTCGRLDSQRRLVPHAFVRPVAPAPPKPCLDKEVQVTLDLPAGRSI